MREGTKNDQKSLHSESMNRKAVLSLGGQGHLGHMVQVQAWKFFFISVPNKTFEWEHKQVSRGGLMVLHNRVSAQQ